MLLQFLLTLQQPKIGGDPLPGAKATGSNAALVKDLDQIISKSFVNGKQFLTSADLKGTPFAPFVDALMFSKIELVTDAWRGVSKADLEIIRGRLLGGESLDAIANGLKTDMLNTRKDVKAGESFDAFVARRRKESGV